jgi:hypothetical protein
VATEVLCSEIWSIVETCLNNSEELLTPFWEIVLERPPEEMKTQIALATSFMKINTVFLGKKPREVRSRLLRALPQTDQIFLALPSRFIPFHIPHTILQFLDSTSPDVGVHEGATTNA